MEVEFVLYLDEDSWTEQGWFMQCDNDDHNDQQQQQKVVVWNNTVGFLQQWRPYLHKYNPRIVDQACVDENATCVFTLIDTWGDGLLSPNET